MRLFKCEICGYSCVENPLPDEKHYRCPICSNSKRIVFMRIVVK